MILPIKMVMIHIHLKRSKIRKFLALKEIENFRNREIIDFTGPENPEDFRGLFLKV